ncbi:hypothetical protein BU15DRAFT_61719 [Melanogaster broomeanus]|nr:hypothetical protein BU15DRAFT_61719 [Melanogaster broomeanus]
MPPQYKASPSSTLLFVFWTYIPPLISVLSLSTELSKNHPHLRFVLTLTPWWLSYWFARSYIRMANQSSPLYHPYGCLAQCFNWVFHWVHAAYYAFFANKYSPFGIHDHRLLLRHRALRRGALHNLITMDCTDTENLGVYETARRSFGRGLAALVRIWYSAWEEPETWTEEWLRRPWERETIALWHTIVSLEPSALSSWYAHTIKPVGTNCRTYRDSTWKIELASEVVDSKRSDKYYNVVIYLVVEENIIGRSRRQLRGVTSTNNPRNPSTSWSSSPRHVHKRAFGSSCVRYNSSIAALSTSSSSRSQPSVRESFTILFCGRDAFSCAVFKEVHNAKATTERSVLIPMTLPYYVLFSTTLMLLVSAPLKTLGEAFGVPVHTIPKEKSDFKHWLPPPPFTSRPFAGSPDSLISLPTSHLLITASFGRILPAAILRLFPETQRLNVHPSLLPAYRGPAPIQRALMAGERQTGVCVIEMGEVSRKQGKLVDAGSIWGIERMVGDHPCLADRTRPYSADDGTACIPTERTRKREFPPNAGNSRGTRREAVGPSPARHAVRQSTAQTARSPLIHSSSCPRDHRQRLSCRLRVPIRHSLIASLERAIGHQRALKVPAGLPDGRAVTIADLHVISSEERPADSNASPEDESPGTASYSPQRKSLLVNCADRTRLSVERLQTQDKAMLTAKEWWNGVKGMGLVKDGRYQFSRGR